MADASHSHILEMAVTFFLIMDPMGNLTPCLALLKDFPPARQRRILLRELFIALALIGFFTFLGEELLAFLGIHQSTLRLSGGVILFIISLRMIFPGIEPPQADADARDPLIAPIATPLIAGPSLLSVVMLYAHREGGAPQVLTAALLAWAATAAIMLPGPAVSGVLGTRGLRAAERLMGLILILMSVQMLEDGTALFLATL